jgi:hypothetical protein
MPAGLQPLFAILNMKIVCHDYKVTTIFDCIGTAKGSETEFIIISAERSPLLEISLDWFGNIDIIIISLLMSPLLGHRPSLWITHKGETLAR